MRCARAQNSCPFRMSLHTRNREGPLSQSVAGWVSTGEPRCFLMVATLRRAVYAFNPPAGNRNSRNGPTPLRHMPLVCVRRLPLAGNADSRRCAKPFHQRVAKHFLRRRRVRGPSRVPMSEPECRARFRHTACAKQGMTR